MSLRHPIMRVTGAWTRLLVEWLDRERLAAPDIRARLVAYMPDDVVPLPVWVELLEAAAALRPERQSPGLEIGAGVGVRHVGVLGYLILAGENLGEAMVTYQRYERLFYGTDLAEVEVQAEYAEIRWPAVPAVGAGVAIANELAIAALITFLRQQMAEAPAPAAVAFTHAGGEADRLACEAFFGCPVRFGDSHTRIRFPLAYLAIPMPHRDPALRELLDRQARALLEALPDPSAFDRAVQQLLVRLLPEGEVAIERAAEVMHQSARTLQRRLAERGLSWQQLLDRTREQLARQYLRDRSLALADIAMLLGYSEQSAFTRAFRRWTGQTPLRFRKAG